MHHYTILYAVHARSALSARFSVPVIIPRRRPDASDEGERPGQSWRPESNGRWRDWWSGQWERKETAPADVHRAACLMATLYSPSSRLLHRAYHRLFLQPRTLHSSLGVLHLRVTTLIRLLTNYIQIISCFAIAQASYIAFLVMFSYMLLHELNPGQFNTLGILLAVWIGTLICEEMHQVKSL